LLSRNRYVSTQGSFLRLAIETSDFAGTVHLRGAADHEEHVLGQVRLAFLPRALEAAVSIAMTL